MRKIQLLFKIIFILIFNLGYTHFSEGQTAICKKAITVSVEPASCDRLVKAIEIDSGSMNYDLLTVSDNFLPVLGQYDVTLIASKFNGNSSLCTTHVTLIDKSAPVAIAKQNVIITLDNNNQYLLQPHQIDNGSFDHCSTVTLSIFPTVLNCETPNPVNIILTVEDQFGNYNQAITLATIEQNPVRRTDLTCRSITEVEVYRRGSTLLTPDLILTGTGYACSYFYQFDLEHNGLALSNYSVNYSDVGKTYLATVTDTVSQTSCQGQITLIEAACDSVLYVCDTKSRCEPVGQCASGHSIVDDVEWPCDIELFNVPNSLADNPTTENLALFMAVNEEDILPQFDVNSCVILGENIVLHDFFEPGNVKLILKKYSYLNWADKAAPAVEYTQIIRLHLLQNLDCDICDTKAWNTPIGNCSSGHTLLDAVEWPADITINTTEASPYDLSLNPLVNPQNVGPILNPECNNFSLFYNDDIDSISPNQYMITRNWAIFNWDNLFEYFYTQHIWIDASTSNFRKICFTDVNKIPVKDVEIYNGLSTANNNCVEISYDPANNIIKPKKVDTDFHSGIDVQDVVLLAESILKNDYFNRYQMDQLDLNVDGNIDQKDLNLIKNLNLRKNNTMTFESPWQFFSANEYFFRGSYNTELPSASPFETLQFLGVKVGDINNDILKGSSMVGNLNIAMDDQLLYNGEVYEIPILNQDSAKVKGLQLIIKKTSDFVLNSVSSNYFNDVSFNEFDDKYIVLCLAGHSDLLNGGLELNPAQDILNLHIKSNSNTVLSKVISVENELGLVVTKSENLRPVLNFEDVIPTSTTDLYGELAVFPNPASHKLSVAVPDHFTIFNLQVYNLNGNLVKTSYTKGDPTLLVETLPNGFYIIKATSTQGVVKSASFIKL